jgi:hypothetical protein
MLIPNDDPYAILREVIREHQNLPDVEIELPESPEIAEGNFERNTEVVVGNRAPIGSDNVILTFDANANNPVNQILSKYFRTIMTIASGQSINSVNISCTTVHPSNAVRSAHTVANGARALDINYINGVHVSTKNPYVLVLQKIIKSTPGYMENYGPNIISKVVNGVAAPAPWARNIAGGHYDHIHLSVPSN